MKISLLINHDYSGGTALWAQNMVAGMLSNGVDVQVIKSTRQRLAFHPDQSKEVKTRNDDDIRKAVRDFAPDFAIFQSGYDAPKQISKHPQWMRSLHDFPVPFTFATHDDAYSYQHPVSQAYLSQMTDHDKFMGVILGFSILPNEMIPRGVYQHESVLPFTVTGDEERSDTREPNNITLFSYVGMVKQWSMLFRAAVLADADKMVNPVTKEPLVFTLYGGAATSAGVSPTTRAWTLLRDLYHAEPIDLDVSDPMSDVHKPLPWSMVLPNGTEIGYHGRFDQTNVDRLMSEQKMVINTTTRRGGSRGPAEYVTLEAIRSRCLTVLPDANSYGHAHLSLSTYNSYSDRHHHTPAILRGEQDETVISMLDSINHEFDTTDSVIDRRYDMLKKHHDPATVVKNILEGGL